MRVILVHYKPGFLQSSTEPWIPGYEFAGKECGKGTFDVEGTVVYEIYPPGDDSVLDESGCIVFAHASHTKDWGNGALSKAEIHDHFARAGIGPVYVLPFTTQDTDVIVPETEHVLYGRESVEEVLKEIRTAGERGHDT